LKTKFLPSIKEMHMKNATISKIRTLALVATLAAYMPATFAQKGKPAGGAKSATASASDAAPKSPCSNQTFCYDTADFTATIAQFRTSTDGSGNKILDAIVHFQNKTDQVLSLGYADGSAESMDDHGNRYELSKNGVRGMGTVAGTTPDAKFVLQPNSTGDARIELQWNPKDQIAGATYELEFSVREMSKGDDKQWSLGNECLLHYDGLANGSASAAGSPHAPGGASPSGDTATASNGATPGASAAASTGSALMSSLTNGTAAATQPCATTTAKAAGAAGSTGQSGAANAVSSTGAAITSISSLFGHKKTTPDPAAATSAASATPCTAATSAAAGAGAGAAGGAKGATKTNAMAQPPAAAPVAATPAATTPVATAATPAHPVAKPTPTPAPKTGVVNTALKQPVVATPVVVAKAPVTPATAAKKPPVVPAATKPTPAPKPATPAATAQ
jgi:hypothetical protein